MGRNISSITCLPPLPPGSHFTFWKCNHEFFFQNNWNQTLTSDIYKSTLHYVIQTISKSTLYYIISTGVFKYVLKGECTTISHAVGCTVSQSDTLTRRQQPKPENLFAWLRVSTTSLKQQQQHLLTLSADDCGSPRQTHSHHAILLKQCTTRRNSWEI